MTWTTDVKSYRFESYVWLTAESETQARERLELIFETSPPEWECTEVADVKDVVETYNCSSCHKDHIVGFVCEDQVR